MQDVLDDDLIEETRIYVCDINPNMLRVGKKRAEERGIKPFFEALSGLCFYLVDSWISIWGFS